MIRLVLDTNTLISAVGWRHSKQRKILEACLFKQYLLIESPQLLEEFVVVIRRPKFSFVSEEQKNEFVTSDKKRNSITREICRYKFRSTK